MTPKFPRELTSPRLRLQTIAPLHAPSLFETVTTDPEVTRYLTWHPHRDLHQAYAMVERCQSMTQERVFAIGQRSADPSEAIGTISMRRSVRGRVDLGYMLSRSMWGQGLMTEAVRAVIGWSLSQPDIWRVAGVCDIENGSSARALSKAGMSLEGVLRCWGWHPNVSDMPRDCYSYAIVRRDETEVSFATESEFLGTQPHSSHRGEASDTDGWSFGWLIRQLTQRR